MVDIHLAVLAWCKLISYRLPDNPHWGDEFDRLELKEDFFDALSGLKHYAGYFQRCVDETLEKNK